MRKVARQSVFCLSSDTCFPMKKITVLAATLTAGSHSLAKVALQHEKALAGIRCIKREYSCKLICAGTVFIVEQVYQTLDVGAAFVIATG